MSFFMKKIRENVTNIFPDMVPTITIFLDYELFARHHH